MDTLHKALCTFMIISRRILTKVSNISDKFVEKIKTHILPVYAIKFKNNRVIYDNVGKCGRAREAII
jgi:hypothetical protein